MAELVFFSGTMDCGKSTLALQMDHNHRQRGRQGRIYTAHDRAGSRLELTQESLSGLLGVQRTTVNAVARELQDEGLITTRRGIIEVHDRDGLQRRACECYDRVKMHYSRLLGTTPK